MTGALCLVELSALYLYKTILQPMDGRIGGSYVFVSFFQSCRDEAIASWVSSVLFRR